MNSSFSRTLLSWNHRENQRLMPWKGEKDPYRVWLSEIILQQTRVEQGLGYYQRFVSRFPDIFSLAKASEQEVFKLWEGLGYYSRCRNMIAAANSVMRDRQGRFPDTYEEIIGLPGVGPYTAAAISSFAFNLPYSVVDGNVYRVLSRVFGIRESPDTETGKKKFIALATDLLDKENPGEYNQAIMDFGALICKPRQPLCDSCPFNPVCVAFRDQVQSILPVRLKKQAKITRHFHYLIIEHENKVLIRERTGRDIWRHLYEFVLFETKELMSETEIAEKLNDLRLTPSYILKKEISATFKQELTHRRICGNFTQIKLRKGIPAIEGYRWEHKSKLKKLPFPRYILSYLSEKK